MLLLDSPANKKQKNELLFKFFEQISFWYDNALDNIVSKNAWAQVFKALPDEI